MTMAAIPPLKPRTKPAAAHTAPNKGGNQERQGGKAAQQLYRRKTDKARQGDCQADGVEDDPLSDINEGRGQKQDDKNAALEQK
jgi:hypothetical protein